MSYEKVFEITQNSNGILSDFYNFLFIEGMILLIGLGIASYVFVNRKSLKLSAWRTPLFLIFWAIVGGFFTISNRPSEMYLNKYKTGEYSIVEGEVKVLRRQPKSGHAPGDSIEIGTSPFTIDYFVSTPTYKTTISNGGVLKDGVCARVYHSYGKILRIDLIEPTAQ